MKKKTEAMKETSEEKVLAAALREFAAYGYDGARIDRIAALSKMNKAMIYYHFKGKEALYERVISDLAGGLFSRLSEPMEVNADPLVQLKDFMARYVEYQDGMGTDFFKIMLREISTGGKYFRKIILPTLVQPIINRIIGLLDRAMKEKKIRDIHPYFTMFQFVGGVVFFNSLRITLEGTDLYKVVFDENYLEVFKNNLIGIIEKGIVAGEKK